ncbi:MAG: hypothetical protein KH452_05810 [Clostridiales bacterium]|nr:hypothetical protein [Clostridiales bacterium]
MKTGSSYRIDEDKISEQNMQFAVVNRRPNYSAQEKETVKAEMEEQLFTVFCRCAHGAGDV